jgi:starch synthase
MTNLIRRFRPDVIHVHDMADYRYLLAVAICRKRFPIVMTVHNAEPHLGKKDNRMEFLRPYLRRLSDRYIVHGQTIKEHLLRVCDIPADKVDCVSMIAYDFHRLWITGRQDNGRTVLFFGGIFEYKGIEYLIKAAPSIRGRFPDARIVIAGSGPDWPRCRSFIEDPDAFELIDRALTNPEVTELFEEASLVVLPYTEASQSGVLGLAYAMGKPVVATTVGSLPKA